LRNSLLFALVAVCFLLSGAAGLLYEVVWMRLLGLSFGHTTWAVTTVLAAYMGGLALGSFLLGRWADRLRRPLLAYGLLEATVGLYCLSTPFLFRSADALYLSLHRAIQPSALTAGAIQFLLSAALMLPPTTLMGATLPVLSRAVVDAPGRVGSQVGTLYAINTWGAVAGTAATGYLLLPTLGLRLTVWLGVALNVAAGGIAMLIYRAARAPRESALARGGAAANWEAAAVVERAPAKPALSRAGRLAALVAIGVSGAAAMAYEIAWTRSLSLVLGSSTYAFSAMLTTFLVGLALGAFVVARLLRRYDLGLFTFGLVETAIAVVALALLPAFGQLPVLVLRILGAAGMSYRGAVLAQFAASFVVMIAPTLLIGASFPLVIHVLGRRLSHVGKDVGTVYGANTVGTIIGAMLAGFVLIPVVGIHHGVMIAAAANLAAGVAVLLISPEVGRRGWWASAAVVAVSVATAIAIPPWDKKLMTSGVSVYAFKYLGEGGKEGERLRAALSDSQQLFYAEGVNTTVTVSLVGSDLALAVNAKIDASNGYDMITQLMLGHLPALLRPDARRALIIGLGSGITAGAVAQHPLEVIDVAELEPAMTSAASFFSRENHGVLQDPRLRIVNGDGRHVLASAARPYDIVVSEPSNPWIAGVANLFTTEFYEIAKRNLAPDGVMVQWLQGYCIFPREMRMVTRTFHDVFPHVSVWRSMKGDYILVGSARPLEVDFHAIRRRFGDSRGVREDFARFNSGPDDLRYHYVLSDAEVSAFAGDAPLNTDDLPLLEFAAPLAMYAGQAVEQNDALLRSARRERLPPSRGLDLARLASPGGRLDSARAHWLLGNVEDAALEIELMGPSSALPLDLRARRARLLFALGSMNAAAAEFEQLSRDAPDDAGFAGYLRASRLLRGELASRLASATNPWRTRRAEEAYDRGGQWFLQMGAQRDEPTFFTMAAAYFEEALKLAPGSLELLNNLGNAYLELKRADAAIDAYRKVLENDPRRFQTQFNLGLAYEHTGRLREAADAYLSASRLAPSWAAPREKLAGLKIAPQ